MTNVTIDIKPETRDMLNEYMQNEHMPESEYDSAIHGLILISSELKERLNTTLGQLQECKKLRDK